HRGGLRAYRSEPPARRRGEAVGQRATIEDMHLLTICDRCHQTRLFVAADLQDARFTATRLGWTPDRAADEIDRLWFRPPDPADPITTRVFTERPLRVVRWHAQQTA